VDSNKKSWRGLVGLSVLASAAWVLPANGACAASLRPEVSVEAHKVKAGARRPIRARVVPAVPSMGQKIGLHAGEDPLELKSSVALVLDQDTNEVLFAKNPQAVLPIASITKLMTAIVVAESQLPLDETLIISAEDVDTEKGSRSKRSRAKRCCNWH
jgi:D-alanyl-D-alanine endopeptidase (penicillin-binding protein 7)